jgi:hypothetical protein
MVIKVAADSGPEIGQAFKTITTSLSLGTGEMVSENFVAELLEQFVGVAVDLDPLETS